MFFFCYITEHRVICTAASLNCLCWLMCFRFSIIRIVILSHSSWNSNWLKPLLFSLLRLISLESFLSCKERKKKWVNLLSWFLLNENNWKYFHLDIKCLPNLNWDRKWSKVIRKKNKYTESGNFIRLVQILQKSKTHKHPAYLFRIPKLTKLFGKSIYTSLANDSTIAIVEWDTDR